MVVYCIKLSATINVLSPTNKVQILTFDRTTR
jgi:hypothetical protein